MLNDECTESIVIEVYKNSVEIWYVPVVVRLGDFSVINTSKIAPLSIGKTIMIVH